VWAVCQGFDPDDRYSKEISTSPRDINSIGLPTNHFKFGIPPPSALNICTPVYRRLFNQAVCTLQSIGGQIAEVDWTPFEAAGSLLYDGTFVSERLASLPDKWLETNCANLEPVIADLLTSVEARQSTAVQAYRDLQAKALYTRQANRLLSHTGGVDVLLVPTTPTHWKIQEMRADPIKKNSMLGYFTHCGNVLDLTAVAVPAGLYNATELDKAEVGTGENTMLPFGVTFYAATRRDEDVLEIARRFMKAIEGLHV
jgi:Asp-tRNA(Asn)/Glu-tRNA(Gln) amidotransferase A subunit family amidase